MRMIVVLLLGMVIFNAMLLLTKDFFPVGEDVDFGAQDVSEQGKFREYQSIDSGFITDLLLTSGSIFGLTIIGAGVGARLIANFPTGQFIGASAVISIVTGLWAGISNPFESIASSFGLQSWYNIFMIVIGIIAVLSVVEIFTPKGDVQ